MWNLQNSELGLRELGFGATLDRGVHLRIGGQTTDDRRRQLVFGFLFQENFGECQLFYSICGN
jgi:hypothetical protein